MRTETEEIRDNLKYLSLLARDYPSQAAAASEIISTQALLKLPKGTEHFMSDLHGENEAFVHILNSASGVIREKVDIVLGDTVPEGTRAELATLIYYPNEKLPQLKERCADEEALEQWYSETLLRLIDICRLVSSKHTREHVRACLPSSCGYILDGCDTGGVLGRQGGDGAHGEDAVHGHGFEVGLNAGTAAGIAARDGKCSFHGFAPLSQVKKFVQHSNSIFAICNSTLLLLH